MAAPDPRPVPRRPRPGELLHRLRPPARSRDAPRAPVGLFVAGAVALSALSLLQARAFTGGYDLGYFAQAATLIGRGEDPYVSLRGLHLLGDHAALVLYPIGLLTRVVPPVPLLLVLQSVALASAVLPLSQLAVDLGVSRRTRTTLLVAALLQPALLNAALADFHPETLAVPLLLAALVAAGRRRWLPYGLALAGVLTCREDLGLTVAAVGALVAATTGRRAGAVTVAAGLGWFALATTVVLPHFAGGTNWQATRFPEFGSTLGSALGAMLRRPDRVWTELWSPEAVGVAAALLVPVALLPALRLRYLLPAAPLLAVYLLSDVAAAETVDFHYHVTAVPFVLAATAAGIARLQATAGRVAGGLAARPLVAGVALGVLTWAHLSPLDHPWERWRRDDRDDAIAGALAVVPDDAAVAASSVFFPGLARRTDLLAFPRPWGDAEGLVDDPVPLGERRSTTSHLVVDRRALGVVYPDDVDLLAELTTTGGFVPVYERDDIAVYERRS